jgi:hypothetical protein
MIWFRLQIRSCAQLALFALALQMVVSFGHVHRDHLFSVAAAVHTPFTSVATYGLPSRADQDHHPASDDDYCPICASIALAGTGLAAMPPIFILPTSVPRVWSPDTTSDGVQTEAVRSFEARAPPLA